MKTDTTKKDTIRFISNVANKDYSEANKSLQKMIENKIKSKVKLCLTQEN
jgi:hypothetical protein